MRTFAEGSRKECKLVSVMRSFSLLNFSDDISDNRAHCTSAGSHVSVHYHPRAVSGSRSRARARARAHARLRVRIRGNAASAVAALLSSAATMKNYPEAAKEREIARDEEGRKKRVEERERKEREKERPREGLRM